MVNAVIRRKTSRKTSRWKSGKRNNSLALRELLGVELIGIEPTTY